jgi:flagellar biosynthesis/type III secretory pathway M-ring protein FliF/YscJ
MLRYWALGLAVLAVVVALVVRWFFDPVSDSPPPTVAAPEKRTESAEEKAKVKARKAGADDEEEASESDSDNEPQEDEGDGNPSSRGER